MRTLFISLLLLFFTPLLAAAPVAPAIRAEIDALLYSLNGCEFNRNGTWHTASEAKVHLLRKLDYLERKNLVQRTEQFIELGASKSSSSGKPYLVRCGNGTPVESKKWLEGQLVTIRLSGRAVEPMPK